MRTQSVQELELLATNMKEKTPITDVFRYSGRAYEPSFTTQKLSFTTKKLNFRTQKPCLTTQKLSLATRRT